MLLLINQLDIVPILPEVVCGVFFLLIHRIVCVSSHLSSHLLMTLWFVGYLPCTDIKEGYYNLDSFQQWITNNLLSHCNVYPAPRSVIIMNNASAHRNPRIQEVIETYKCRVKYLPLYSPNYNLIELSFSILKAWMRRHFHESWPYFDDTFGDFLRYAVDRSQCD
jgi:hypothetical protein